MAKLRARISTPRAPPWAGAGPPFGPEFCQAGLAGAFWELMLGQFVADSCRHRFGKKLHVPDSCQCKIPFGDAFSPHPAKSCFFTVSCLIAPVPTSPDIVSSKSGICPKAARSNCFLKSIFVSSGQKLVFWSLLPHRLGVDMAGHQF